MIIKLTEIELASAILKLEKPAKEAVPIQLNRRVLVTPAEIYSLATPHEKKWRFR